MVIVGIDGHKQTLACSLVDELGREFGAETFANEPAGHDALLAWVAQSAQSESVEYALESAFSFTRSFCERLGAQGEVVYDVPAMLVERRRRRRGIGKSDVLDAREIARALLREHARMVPLTPISPIVRDLKLLVEHYTQLVRERTQTANRLHADLVRLLPGYQHTIPSFESLKAQKAAARLLRRQQASVHQTIALQRLARISELDKQVTQTKRQLLLIVRASGSGLLELRGVGPISAARILAEVRDVRRFTSADAFARYAAVDRSRVQKRGLRVCAGRVAHPPGSDVGSCSERTRRRSTPEGSHPASRATVRVSARRALHVRADLPGIRLHRPAGRKAFQDVRDRCRGEDMASSTTGKSSRTRSA